jgi:hypothetical protein
MPRVLGDLNWSGYDLMLYCPSENGPHKAISKTLFSNNVMGEAACDKLLDRGLIPETPPSSGKY